MDGIYEKWNAFIENNQYLTMKIQNLAMSMV